MITTNYLKRKGVLTTNPARTVIGPMLQTGGMGDRVANEKRKSLAAELEAQKLEVTTKPEPVVTPLVTLSSPLPEVPIIPSEPPTDLPEKKKPGRPKKETKDARD